MVVVGGLRAVKDPLRAGYAVRALPLESLIRVTCIGPVLAPGFDVRARRETQRNPRFRWIGPRPHRATLRRIAASDLLVVSSRSEGGANVIGEAIVAGVPVISSAIDGSIGILGGAYPGYFPVGDTRALTRLLRRAETDRAFLRELQRLGRRLAPRFAPARERTSWRTLLAGLAVRPSR
ncbi:MAG: glycosyltransferase [Candidatus Dormibacteria bacterium]